MQERLAHSEALMTLIGLRILETDDRKNGTGLLEVFSHHNPDLVKLRFGNRTITVDLRLLHLTIQHLVTIPKSEQIS
jgi:hypothetical protein